MLHLLLYPGSPGAALYLPVPWGNSSYCKCKPRARQGRKLASHFQQRLLRLTHFQKISAEADWVGRDTEWLWDVDGVCLACMPLRQSKRRRVHTRKARSLFVSLFCLGTKEMTIKGGNHKSTLNLSPSIWTQTIHTHIVGLRESFDIYKHEWYDFRYAVDKTYTLSFNNRFLSLWIQLFHNKYLCS